MLATVATVVFLSGCTGAPAATTPAPSGSGSSPAPSVSTTPTGPTTTLLVTAKGPADILIVSDGAETIRILSGTWRKVIPRPAEGSKLTLEVKPVDKKKAIKLTCTIKQGKKTVSTAKAKKAGKGVTCEL